MASSANVRVQPKDLALFYRTLAEMLDAGVPILRALETVAATVTGSGLRRVIQQLHDRIEQGGTLADSMAAFADAFPALHLEVVSVAEQSGRIGGILRELAAATDQQIRLRRIIVSGSLLPLVLFHVAVFIVPLPALLVGGTLTGYLQASLGAAVVLWAVLLGGVALVRTALRTASGRGILDRLLRPLPLLGQTWRELDYWRVVSGVEMMTAAGLGVLTALHRCAPVCRSPRLARALVDAANRAESAGGAVSIALAATGEFPQELLSLWSTGEQSGHLDDMLQRLARMYSERCELRMQEIAKWLPRLAYAAVSLYLVIQILRLGANYANMLRSVE